ncbi:phage portal protein [Devosia sp. 2618]|uniref:phage portal protein n=1 Tax=Devosia sp. 2618 TaxID=3156454 RepID=UPI00339B4F85
MTDFLPGLFRKADPEPAPEPVTLTDPLASWLFGAMPTHSNVAVTPKSAMQVPAVSSAVELIAEAVGTLPAKLFVRNAEGKEADPAHPAFRLVHDEANDWTSAAELRTQLTHDALLHDKGGFAVAVRGGSGNVVEFHQLDPLAVEIKTDPATREPFYLVREGRKNVRYEYRDMLHIQAFGGKAPITRARNAIALAMTLEEHASRLFSSGAHPSGALATEKAMKPDEAANLIAMWEATHSGSANSGKPALLTNGVKWEQTALTSTDAQFLENRRYQVEEIARTFRVPPTMLFDLTRGTWSNTEEMRQGFLEQTLRPWLDAWAWAYARVLLTPEERTSRFIGFITDDLLTVNPTVRTDIYGKLVAMRAMTPNDVRAGLNMPAMPGGDVLQNPYTTTSAAPDAANDDTPPIPEKDAA